MYTKYNYDGIDYRGKDTQIRNDRAFVNNTKIVNDFKGVAASAKSMKDVETETVSLNFTRDACKNDRFVGDYHGYNGDGLDIIISREYNRGDYGVATDQTYHSRDEVIADLEKLNKIYSDYPGFTYYNQNLYLENYKYDSIQVAGCCPTSFAMVATYLTGEDVLPTDVIGAFQPYCYESGTDVTGNCFPDVASQYGLTPKMLDWHNPDVLKAELEANHPIILNVSAGDFTNSGHYIVLLGIDKDGNVIVADPNSVSNSTRTYSLDRLISQTHEIDAAAWSFSKN